MEKSTVLMHEEALLLQAADFDAKGRVKASSLMYAFQEAAAAHAEILGVGFEPLMAQNYIWVLTKLRFKIYADLKAGESYRLETYPRPKKGVTFFRDFYIYDGEGSDDGENGTGGSQVPVVIGTSQWCIINFATRRIERTKIDFNDQSFIDHEAFEGGVEKFKVNEDALVFIGSHNVTEDDLDENQHVNNCRYADMVEKVLEGHTDFTIHFSKEARLGDVIGLYQEELDGATMVVGKLPDDVVVFQAKVY